MTRAISRALALDANKKKLGRPALVPIGTLGGVLRLLRRSTGSTDDIPRTPTFPRQIGRRIDSPGDGLLRRSRVDAAPDLTGPNSVFVREINARLASVDAYQKSPLFAPEKAKVSRFCVMLMRRCAFKKYFGDKSVSSAQTRLEAKSADPLL